jgi:hypothetical protein
MRWSRLFADYSVAMIGISRVRQIIYFLFLLLHIRGWTGQFLPYLTTAFNSLIRKDDSYKFIIPPNFV